MAPSIVHMPNGQTLTVSPSFGGLYFKSNELNTHHNVFPPGWTIILHSEDEPEDHEPPAASSAAHSQLHPDHAQRAEDHIPVLGASKEQHIHRFKRPTLKNDHLFISSISNPSSHEFRPPTSPTRQIAMMLWATLWWYFHQPEPSPQLTTGASANTPDAGKPKGEWRININREGIFKSKHLLPKLERMGLIATEDSAVGLDTEEGVGRNGEGWNHMFVSRRAFWQLDPRIYLFTIAPAGGTPSPYPSMSPSGSRPASPNRAAGSSLAMATRHVGGDETPGTPSLGPTSGGSFLWRASTPPGPFSSGSHLPTFYPPAPAQYKWTGNVRHPIRPKFPRQGETFYTRYVPSLGQYLSFRVASLSPKPILHRGPVSLPSPDHPANNTNKPLPAAMTNLSVSDDNHPVPTTSLSDVELLHKWMNDPRVAYSWGETGPISHQQEFLANNLQSGHSFPVIGSFDGKPFGYFEIYYVKEDKLAAHMGGRDVGDWDRGLHVLVGEQEFRGSHRVKVWLSALVHYCWTADLRTERVVMEPRVDNEKLKSYCEQVGFWKEKEVSFPHKQSNLMKIRRDSWEQPAL